MIFSTFALLFSSISFPTGFSNIGHTNPTLDVAGYQFHYSVSFNSFNEIDNNDRYTITHTLTSSDGSLTQKNFLNITYHDYDNELYIYCNSTNSNYFMRFVLSNQDEDFSYDSGFLYDFLRSDNMDYSFTIPTPLSFAYSIDLYYYYMDANFYNDYIVASGNDAVNSGYQDGYDAGYDAGYDGGKQDGTQEGYDNGYNDGYDSGYNTGKTDGYNQGYNVALNTHDFSFTNLFASISDTPILFLRRMFNFGIFGVSAISILFSLFTCLIFIKIIKRFI